MKIQVKKAKRHENRSFINFQVAYQLDLLHSKGIFNLIRSEFYVLWWQNFNFRNLNTLCKFDFSSSFQRLYKHISAVPSILHFAAPGRITYDDAISNLDVYNEVSVGTSFGPSYVLLFQSTTFFFKFCVHTFCDVEKVVFIITFRSLSYIPFVILHKDKKIQSLKRKLFH